VNAAFTRVCALQTRVGAARTCVSAAHARVCVPKTLVSKTDTLLCGPYRQRGVPERQKEGTQTHNSVARGQRSALHRHDSQTQGPRSGSCRHTPEPQRPPAFPPGAPSPPFPPPRMLSLSFSCASPRPQATPTAQFVHCPTMSPAKEPRSPRDPLSEARHLIKDARKLGDAMVSLARLRLTNSILAAFIPDLASLTALTELRLESNQLTTLPDTLGTRACALQTHEDVSTHQQAKHQRMRQCRRRLVCRPSSRCRQDSSHRATRRRTRRCLSHREYHRCHRSLRSTGSRPRS
jgi:hypothetical protein